MTATVLFYPMLAMFSWTFLVLLRTLQLRLSAIGSGAVKAEYFETFDGAAPPKAMVKANNQLRNLAEFPPLFYVVCLAAMVTEQSDTVFVTLAWAYVALRVGHGIVHLTINRVPPRFLLFFLSNILLLTMWLRLATAL